MAGETPVRGPRLFTHFEQDNATLNETVVSSATQDILDRHGGWWRMTCAGDDADAVLLAGERIFEVDEGEPIIFETRVRISDVSVACVFVGFTDDVSESVAIPYENEGGGVNAVAADSIGFSLEGEEDETWQAVGAQNTVANTAEALTAGADAVDDTTQVLRIELSAADNGTAIYSIDGKEVARKTSWFRSGILFAPCLAVDDRNSAFTVDFDYLEAGAPAGAT